MHLHSEPQLLNSGLVASLRWHGFFPFRL